MANDPVLDTRSFLDSQIASLTEGTNLFSGPPGDSQLPHNAVFVQSIGGPSPVESMGETSEFRIALVNIFVRNQSWKTGRDLAKEVLNAFNGLNGGPSGYEHVQIRQSWPGDLGRDDSGAYWFNVVVRLRWNESL